MSETRYVALGEVARPHGIKGELRITLHADSPSLFGALQAVWLRRGEDRPRRYPLRSWRLHQGTPLLSLEGVEDRTTAESFRGLSVVIPAEELPELPEDEVYLYELEGFGVLLASEEPGGEPTPLGVLSGFIEAGGQEVWAIRTPEGKEILFPVAEEFVESIDEEAEAIVIQPPPGLIELYLGEDWRRPGKAPAGEEAPGKPD